MPLKKLASGVKQFEVIVRYRGQLRRAWKMFFSKKDASIYLVPYASGGEYFFGGHGFPEKQATGTFSFAEQLSSELPPKLSVHQSGRVHVRFDKERTPPISMPPLTKLHGEHVATIVVDRFCGLPLVSRELKPAGTSVDVVLEVHDEVVSGRFALYINGSGPVFSGAKILVRIIRSTLPSPLWIGVAPIPQAPVADPSEKQGVTLIAFDPTDTTKFLYLRGQ